jgi:hypothetical protein
MAARVLLLMTVALFTNLSHAADSHRKTDIVTLYDGDKVTGEVKNLFSGLLEVSTKFMGTVKIEWRQVARIESLYRYEIAMVEGSRYYGKMETSSRPGELRFIDADGEHSFSALEVVEIRPVSETLKDRIDIHLALGYSYTKASSLGQGSFNTDIGYETDRARNVLTGRLYLTDTESEVTNSGKMDLRRSVWTKRKGSFRYLLGTYETNDELELDYRLSAGGGLGHQFVKSPRSTWEGGIGAQLLTEKTLSGDTLESAEAVLRTEYSTWKYTTPELRLKLDLSIFPSLTESGRVRADTDINIRWELVEDFYWEVTAFGTYDNQATEDSEFDYGISTGVGWEY